MKRAGADLAAVLDRQFAMTDFVVSTDSDLGSEDNRCYDMAEGRDYICAQSLPSLKMLQLEIQRAFPEAYKDDPLSIDALVHIPQA